MCTIVATHPMIGTVLNEMIQSGKMFTAFDVTKEVRQRVGRNVNIRHGDVQQFVHANFLDMDGVFPSDYNREVTHLANGATPFLYYPVASNPADYLNGGQAPAVDLNSQLQNVLKPAANPTTDNTINSIFSSDEEVRVVTQENRVNVPKNLLDKITMVSGSYDVSIDGNTKFVTPTEADNRVRVTVTSVPAGACVTVKANQARNCIEISTKTN